MIRTDTPWDKSVVRSVFKQCNPTPGSPIGCSPKPLLSKMFLDDSGAELMGLTVLELLELVEIYRLTFDQDQPGAS